MAYAPQSEEKAGPTGISSGQDLSKRQGLIAVNDLNYVLEPDLSVASNKTHKTHFFQNSTYTPGQNAICILNSGADYIDTRRSWLQFDVQTNDVTTQVPFSDAQAGVRERAHIDGRDLQKFGSSGSACNFIKQLTVSTRSGDVLCQLFDFNLMSAMMLPITYDKDWFDSVGTAMAYGGFITANNTSRFIIPMYILSPLFAYGRLMPAMLMSGLRIEIVWEDANKAYYSLGGPDGHSSQYIVQDPQFHLSSVQLSDSIQRALNELSATNGLEIVYCDYEKDQHSSGGALTQLNMEVRKSCSRALKAFARVRVTSSTDAGYPAPAGRDNFRSEISFPFLEYQWRLGSLYFPQQPVRAKSDNVSDRAGMAVSSYVNLLEASDKYHGGAIKSSHIPLTAKSDQAINNTLCHFNALGSFCADQHMLGVTLERSTMFNLAGIPVNNSRVLSLNAKLFPTTSEPGVGPAANFERQVTVFLKYVRLARVFLNNVEVEQ